MKKLAAVLREKLNPPRFGSKDRYSAATDCISTAPRGATTPTSEEFGLELIQQVFSCEARYYTPLKEQSLFFCITEKILLLKVLCSIRKYMSEIAGAGKGSRTPVS